VKKPKAPIKLGVLSRTELQGSETQPRKLLSFSNIPQFDEEKTKEDQNINQEFNFSSRNEIASFRKINESKFSNSGGSEKKPPENDFDPLSENFGKKITPPPSAKKRNAQDLNNFIFHNSNLKEDKDENESVKFQYKTVIIKEESEERSNSVKTDRLRMSEYMLENFKSKGMKTGGNPVIQSMIVRKSRGKSKHNKCINVRAIVL
jgi:hypothetical protein